MTRHLKALVLVLACVAIGCALNAIPVTTYPLAPSVQVWLSGHAKRQLDSLAWLTGITREEQAVCITGFRLVETENGTVVTIDSVSTANEHWSDSVSIYTRKEGDMLCRSTIPVLHTHVVPNSMWGQPSPVDEWNAQRYYTAPFHVLLSVGADHKPAKLTVYGMR